MLVVRDSYPVSPGHTLIVSSRHIRSLIELSKPEWADLQQALQNARNQIDAEYAPDGYNVGVNDGVAAGQTVSHLHVHLIPRYKGDMEDPRGGVRWILKDQADYWSK